MRATFLFAFVLGLAGVLVGGFLVPWGQHERVASKTGVAMNGGRQETFLIYLPSDRLVDIVGAEGYPVSRASTLSPPPELAAVPFIAEHFKLRDIDGVVIGLASRHWSTTTVGGSSVWVLNIPSRGTIVLASDGDVPSRLGSALAGARSAAGPSWSGDLEVAVAGAEAAPRVVTGTEEFETVTGRYAETWRISGVDEQSELSGTIVLETIVNQRS